MRAGWAIRRSNNPAPILKGYSASHDWSDVMPQRACKIWSKTKFEFSFEFSRWQRTNVIVSNPGTASHEFASCDGQTDVKKQIQSRSEDESTTTIDNGSKLIPGKQVVR